jgi:hypothetical protein
MRCEVKAVLRTDWMRRPLAVGQTALGNGVMTSHGALALCMCLILFRCEWPSGPNALLPLVRIENLTLFNNTVHDCGGQSMMTHPHVSIAPRSGLMRSVAADCSRER